MATLELNNDKNLSILSNSLNLLDILGYDDKEFEKISGNDFLGIFREYERHEILEIINKSHDDKENISFNIDTVLNGKNESINLLIVCHFMPTNLKKNKKNTVTISISNKTEYKKICVKLEETEEIKELKKLNDMYILTQVLNRGAIEKLINIRLNENIKEEINFALCIIDLDYFKLINDTYGHLFGDRFLRDFTTQIRATFNKNILLGRIGGDEFILLLEYREIRELNIKMDLLAKNIGSIYISDTETNKISASIGVALYPKDGLTYKELLKNADIALYNVKADGRNGYLVYNKNLKTLDLISKNKVEKLRTDIIKFENIFDIINFQNSNNNFNIAV